MMMVSAHAAVTPSMAPSKEVEVVETAAAAGADAGTVYKNDGDGNGNDDDDTYAARKAVFHKAFGRAKAGDADAVAAALDDGVYKNVAANMAVIMRAAGVKTKAMDFQMVPITWMVEKERRHAEEGGILADPMGLGKTFMAIAYATVASHLNERQMCSGEGRKRAHKRTHKRTHKRAPTLIVCPKTLVAYWRDEIQKHTTTGPYEIVVYHGPQRKSYDKAHMRSLRFIITTYEVVRNEAPSAYNAAAVANITTAAGRGGNDSVLFNTTFARIFLDEAHRVRTPRSLQTQAVMLLNSNYRWCVTGTPFNNRVTDLLSLSQFINVAPYSQAHWWQTHTNASKTHWRKNYLMMREKPAWMPPVHTHEEVLEMDADHAKFYDYIAKMAAQHYHAYCHSSRSQQKRLFNGLLVWLLRLRQTAIHPLLMLWAFHKRRGKSASLPCASLAVAASPIDNDDANDVTNDSGGDDRELDGEVVPAENDCDFAPNNNPFDVPGLCKAWVHGLEGYTSTTKLTKLLDLIQNILAGDATKKIVVFSQWTSCLDLIEREFETNLPSKYRFIRLDGSIASADERNGLVHTFRNDAAIRVFLSTTQAGGVGINLEMAQVVIMFDAWFNPFSEDQAVDRVHRVTQKRDVDVYRMRVADTVESDVLRIQMNKRRKAKEELGLLNSDGPISPAGGGVANGKADDVAMNSLSKDEVCSIFRKRPANAPQVSISVTSADELRASRKRMALDSDGAVNNAAVFAALGLQQRNLSANKKVKYK